MLLQSREHLGQRRSGANEDTFLCLLYVLPRRSTHACVRCTAPSSQDSNLETLQIIEPRKRLHSAHVRTLIYSFYFVSLEPAPRKGIQSLSFSLVQVNCKRQD